MALLLTSVPLCVDAGYRDGQRGRGSVQKVWLHRARQGTQLQHQPRRRPEDGDLLLQASRMKDSQQTSKLWKSMYDHVTNDRRDFTKSVLLDSSRQFPSSSLIPSSLLFPSLSQPHWVFKNAGCRQLAAANSLNAARHRIGGTRDISFLSFLSFLSLSSLDEECLASRGRHFTVHRTCSMNWIHSASSNRSKIQASCFSHANLPRAIAVLVCRSSCLPTMRR